MVEVNSGPLSDCSKVGRPKWGMSSLKSMVATVEALLLVGKASIHPVKVSMKTRRYLIHLIGSVLVKSTCQSDPSSCVMYGKGRGLDV
jgi:hypothetical protein